MKSVDCEIVRYLLANYIDNLSSNSTNKIIEKHLQTCQACNNTLNDMRNEASKEYAFKQEEQIDYLKGYKRKKRINIVVSVIITILVLIICAMSLLTFLRYNEFYVNIDDILVQSDNIKEMTNNEREFMFAIYDHDKKNEYKCYKYEVVEDTGIKTMHIKAVGKFPFYGGDVCWCYVKIDNTIDKIYLEDKRGNIREIWDKEIGLYEQYSDYCNFG